MDTLTFRMTHAARGSYSYARHISTNALGVPLLYKCNPAQKQMCKNVGHASMQAYVIEAWKVKSSTQPHDEYQQDQGHARSSAGRGPPGPGAAPRQLRHLDEGNRWKKTMTALCTWLSHQLLQVVRRFAQHKDVRCIVWRCIDSRGLPAHTHPCNCKVITGDESVLSLHLAAAAAARPLPAPSLPPTTQQAGGLEQRSGGNGGRARGAAGQSDRLALQIITYPRPSRPHPRTVGLPSHSPCAAP